MTSRVRNTAAWRRLAKLVIEEEGGICWLCGQPGADTADHVVEVRVAPHLALVRSNVRAAHGRKRVLELDGFDCRGNFGRSGWIPVDNVSEDW
jgi:5-methylcytosine-specific restriction endonuclease McrA